jgi:D-ribulokinase
VGKKNETSLNIIVWMDHRATKEAEMINKTESKVLERVGGKMSAEMQIPKLLWLKNNLPSSFLAAHRFCTTLIPHLPSK